MRVQSEVETAYRFENSLKRIPSSRENIYVVLCQKINFSTRFIRSRHESVHIYTWFLTRIRIEIIRIEAETNERGFLSRKNERSTFPSNRCVASLCRSFFQKNFLSLSLSLSLRFSLTSIHVTVIARVSARTPRERHYTLLRPMELRGNEEHRAPFLHATDR